MGIFEKSKFIIFCSKIKNPIQPFLGYSVFYLLTFFNSIYSGSPHTFAVLTEIVEHGVSEIQFCKMFLDEMFGNFDRGHRIDAR